MVLTDVRLMDHPRPALYAVEIHRWCIFPLPLHMTKKTKNEINELLGSSKALTRNADVEIVSTVKL